VTTRTHVRVAKTTWKNQAGTQHQSFQVLVDRPDQSGQRCDGCGRRGLHWVERGRRLEACPRCGGPLRDVKERRIQGVGSYPTQKEAKAAKNELAAKADRGEWTEPSKMTLAEYLPAWLEGRQDLRESTRCSYAGAIAHVVSELGDVQLQHLTADDVRLLEARVAARGLSGRSVLNVHQVLGQAMRSAANDGLVLRNVVAQVKRPKTRPAEMHVWKAEQLAAALESLRGDRHEALWFLLATTGMRRGEALGLRWSDVDLAAGTAAIRRSLVSVNYQIRFEEPKAKKGRRSVPLAPATVAALRAHHRRQLEERLAWGSDYRANDLVFCKSNGEPEHPDRVSDRWDVLVRRSGLPRLCLHDLRHTWATIALQAGVHPKVVQEILGHSSIAITLDIYSSFIPAMGSDATAKVADLVFGSA
jgi:integrase